MRGSCKKIAIENNLSESAFIVKEGEKYHIRWFTPGGEIDLCGHATLGSTYVLSRFVDSIAEKIVFSSKSGDLIVKKTGDLFEMDFPSRMPKEIEVTDVMRKALKGLDAKAYISRDLMLVLDREEDVFNFEPDFRILLTYPRDWGFLSLQDQKNMILFQEHSSLRSR